MKQVKDIIRMKIIRWLLVNCIFQLRKRLCKTYSNAKNGGMIIIINRIKIIFIEPSELKL